MKKVNVISKYRKEGRKWGEDPCILEVDLEGKSILKLNFESHVSEHENLTVPSTLVDAFIKFYNLGKQGVEVRFIKKEKSL